MRYAIDRFEEQKAILQDENGNSKIVDKAVLPLDVIQGDVVVLCNGLYQHDYEETAKRRNQIYRLEQILRSKRKDTSV